MPQTFKVVIDWDGSSVVYGPETITIKVANGTKLIIPTETISTVERDPGNTGGSGTTFDATTKTFSGSIDYYAADETLNRTAGNRVGIKITVPSTIYGVSGWSKRVCTLGE